MSYNNSEFKSFDGTPLTLYNWNTENPKAIVLITHGMSEHAARYNNFAEFLNTKDILVIASDLRGHGKTAGPIENVGHFATVDGWKKVVTDIITISESIKKEFPKLPLILLGHSMGSFIVRAVAFNKPSIGNAYIFSSTAGHPGLKGVAGEQVAKANMKLFGKRNRSKFLTNLAFGDYNKRYENARTIKDWLSKDEKIVDDYIADPYCMQIFSSQFYCDLLHGLLEVNNIHHIKKMDKNKAVLLFAGDMDPVGNYGEGPTEVYNKMKEVGIQNIELKIFKDGRHEMLNEINKDEVYNMIISWINKQI